MFFEDFKEMCNILITPFEIILYLDYRKKFYEQYGDVRILIKDKKEGISISKPSNKENLVYSFLQERCEKSKLLQQNQELLDFKNFMHNLPDYTIVNSTKDANYTVLLFLAILDRSEICEFMKRLTDT